MTLEALCVGHAAYDVSLFLDGFPAENSKVEIEDALQSGGGPAANAACLLSHWGTQTAFAGLVGDDHYGRCIRDELAAIGTDVSLLELAPGHSTPFSVILVNQQTGSRTIINRKSRGHVLQPAPSAFAGLTPKVLLFDGHELEASLAALKVIPDAMSILDAGSWRAGTVALAGKVDYLVASERFARQAAGVGELRSESDWRRCVSRLREQFATTVVVALGEAGLIADAGSGFRHLPAFPAQAVDTTGAGDIFHGAFAFAMTRDMDLWEGLRFASMAASLSVRVRGGRASIPTLAAVQEAMSHAG